MDSPLNFQLHCMLITVFIKTTEPTIEVVLTALTGEHTKSTVKLPVSSTQHQKAYLISSAI